MRETTPKGGALGLRGETWEELEDLYDDLWLFIRTCDCLVYDMGGAWLSIFACPSLVRTILFLEFKNKIKSINFFLYHH